MPDSGDVKKKIESFLEDIGEIDSPFAAWQNVHKLRDLVQKKHEHSSLKQVGEAFVGNVKEDIENVRDKITNARVKETTKTAVIRFLLLSIVPLLAILIGGINLNDCPINPGIPAWLLIFGILAIAKNVLSLLIDVWASDSMRSKLTIVKGILSILLLIWFVIGLCHVWKTWGEYSGDSTSTNYCDHLTMIYSRIVVFFLVLCLSVVLLLALIRGCLHLKERLGK